MKVKFEEFKSLSKFLKLFLKLLTSLNIEQELTIFDLTCIIRAEDKR